MDSILILKLCLCLEMNMKTDLKNDIYDADVFDLESFHLLEHDEKNSPFRWTEGLFKVIPKQEVKNLFINFECLGGEKKIIIFLENKIKNLKYEKMLQDSKKYILEIPLKDISSVSLYVTPNIKTNEKEVRNLGLLVKKIYTNDTDINVTNLVIREDDSLLNTDIEIIKSDDFVEKNIFEQNNNVKILDLKYNIRNFEFNSSIFEFNNKKYIMTRNSRFVTKLMTLNWLRLYEYDTLNEIKLNIKEEVDFEQYEDPRVLVHNDRIYVSCATYVHNAFHLVHQKMLVFDKNFNHIDNIHLDYGFNGGSLKESTGIEKNWTFFVYKDRLMCVYKLYPHTVLEFDWTGKLLTEYITHNNFKWNYGPPRGGANPIYKDGFYYSFFHSHTYWGNGKRRYFMGMYKFNANPPFDVVEVKSDPILFGNEKDERIYNEHNPLVVFPCGAILEDDKFVVSFGLNDEKTAIITL